MKWFKRWTKWRLKFNTKNLKKWMTSQLFIMIHNLYNNNPTSNRDSRSRHLDDGAKAYPIVLLNCHIYLGLDVATLPMWIPYSYIELNAQVNVNVEYDGCEICFKHLCCWLCLKETGTLYTFWKKLPCHFGSFLVTLYIKQAHKSKDIEKYPGGGGFRL